MANLLKAITSEVEGDSFKAFFSYISEKAVKIGAPLTGTFELTPRCTLDCSMCYVHLKHEQMHCPELITEQWLNLIGQACDAGMLFAKVTGGECMLHPGFKEICQALFDRGVIVSILTNGTLIDEAMTEWLARYPVECVQITVYGSSPEGYAAVTGHPEAFGRIDHALTLLKEAGIRFTTPITISRQLAPDLTNIVKYCLSKEPLRLTISPNPFPARPETGRQHEDYCLALDEEVTLLKQYYDLIDVSYEPHPLDDKLLEPGDNSAIAGIACKAGKSAFSISWDGLMMPCNSVFWMKMEPLRVGFEHAWKEIRKMATNFKYPDKCSCCGLRNACTRCPIAHYDMISCKVQLNDAICYETQRLVVEGLRRI